MPLKDILFATSTSSEIEATAREHLKMVTQTPFELTVRNREGVTLALSIVVVYAFKKGGLLHARTANQEHVFIKLGEVAERTIRKPSIVLYKSAERSQSTHVLKRDKS